MNRKILMPIKKPEEIKRPRNALQEAIDRALRPQKTELQKTELQKKADKYYDKAERRMGGRTRFDSLCR